MRWIAVALIFSTALAGCSDSGANVSGIDKDDDAADQEIGNNTLPPLPNKRPLPSLDVSSLTGSVPLTVNFTLEGADPDNDTLYWSLDMETDGQPEFNGTELPAVVNYTFTVNGTFN